MEVVALVCVAKEGRESEAATARMEISRGGVSNVLKLGDSVTLTAEDALWHKRNLRRLDETHPLTLAIKSVEEVVIDKQRSKADEGAKESSDKERASLLARAKKLGLIKSDEEATSINLEDLKNMLA